MAPPCSCRPTSSARSRRWLAASPIIRAGRIVDVDDVRTLRAHAGQHIELRFTDPVDPAPFAALPGVRDVAVEGTTLRFLLHGEPDALLKLAATEHVERLTAQDRELEDLFLDFYRVPADPRDATEEVSSRG